VLRPDGRIALCDVTADRTRLPAELLGSMATIACVGEALPADGYLSLLRSAGLEPFAEVRRDEDADALARRVEERLRGARLLGVEQLGIEIDAAIALLAQAREAIAAGALGYSIFAACAPASGSV